MKKKYYLRGLGLGILVTALVFIVAESPKMSDEEIIKRAEELGYVKQSADISPTISIKDLMETETPIPTPTNIPDELQQDMTTPEAPSEPTEPMVPDEQEEIVTPAPTTTLTPVPTSTPIPTPEPSVVTATIFIERGNTATIVCNKMQEAGIVKSGEEFKKHLVDNNLTDYINVGSFTLSSDMSFKEMAKILTGR